MKRQLALIILLLLPTLIHVSATSRTIVVSLGSPCLAGDITYDSIQLAVDNASPGDSIVICPGTYLENVVVRKSDLRIYGYGDPSTVIVEAQNVSQNTFKVTGASNVVISNLTLKGAGSQMAGIYLFRVTESSVENVITEDNFYGIYVASSSAIRIANVTARNNDDAGLFLENSVYSNVTESFLYRNSVGITISHGEDILVSRIKSNNNTYGGILLKYTENSTLENSAVAWNGWYGVYLQDSSYNRIANLESRYNNMIGNESIGLYLYQGSHHNSVVNSSIVGNVYGIVMLDYSGNNNVTEVKLLNNSIAGLFFYWSNDNSISESLVKGSRYGVYIMDSSRNVVGECNLTRNSWGVYIYGVDGSFNNTVNESLIYNNTYSGAVVEGNSVGNKFMRTEFWSNGLLGIDLGVNLVTPNNGTLDNGPNRYVDYPVIEWAVIYGSNMLVRGYVNEEGAGEGSSAFNGTVELFLSDDDPSGYGEGKTFLGSLQSVNGEFLGWVSLPDDLPEEFNITGTLTMDYGTSEFGPNYPVIRVYTDLAIHKEMSPDVVNTGEVVNVTLLVTNSGNGTAYNVTVTDDLPDGLDYIAGSSRVNGEPLEPHVSGNTLTWRLDVPANSSTIITFRVRATAPPGSVVRNVAVLSQGDFNSTDDDEITVTEEPNLRIIKTSSVSTAYIGDTVTYAIDLINLGHGTTHFTLVDRLPEGMSLIRDSLRSSDVLDRLESNGTAIIAEGSIRSGHRIRIIYKMKAETEGIKRNLVVLNGSISTSTTVVVTERPPTSGGIIPPCPADPGSSGGSTGGHNSNDDGESPNNSNYRVNGIPIVMVAMSGVPNTLPSSGTGQVVEQPTNHEKSVARILLEKYVTPSVATQGELVTFIIRVKNLGEVQANHVVVVDSLPQGLDYIPGSSKLGGVKDEPERNGNTLRWEIPVILPKKIVEISFKAKVLTHSGELRNEVRFNGSMAYATLRVIPKEKPKEEKISLPPPPPVANIKLDGSLEGEQIRYVITITSPTGANAKVVDDLPSYLSYVPGTSVVNGRPLTPETSGNNLEWKVSVPKGGSVRISFKASINEGFDGDKIVNRAYLPSFGKSDEHVIRLTPKQRSYQPPTLPSIPWWISLLLLIPPAIFLALRRRGEGRGVIVLDYESLRVAIFRGMLEDLLQNNIIVLSSKTFSKIEKNRDLMALINKYIVSGDITIRKVPKKAPKVKGIDEETASAIALAESIGAVAYSSDPKLVREMRKLGFNVKLLRKDVPAQALLT